MVTETGQLEDDEWITNYRVRNLSSVGAMTFSILTNYSPTNPYKVVIPQVWRD